MPEKINLCGGFNDSAKIIFENNKAKGFWDGDRNIGELLMLVTSELGEAMEAHRQGRFADWDGYEKEANGNVDTIATKSFENNIKDTFEDEIADAMIRLLDLSAGLGIDIERHVRDKVKYNETRAHLHGKKY